MNLFFKLLGTSTNSTVTFRCYSSISILILTISKSKLLLAAFLSQISCFFRAYTSACSILYVLVLIVFTLSFFAVVSVFQDMERAITRDLVMHILEFSVPLLEAVTFTAELDW